MKLLLITGSLGTGGLERISCFVANYFIKKGWDVDILALFEKEDGSKKVFNYLEKKVKIHYFTGNFDPLNNKKKAIFPWIKLIKNTINLVKPDSILCMTFKIGSLAAIAAPRYREKITVREINDPKASGRSQFSNKITELFCRKIKSVIFQTQWEQSCYGATIRKKGAVIPNPITINCDKVGTYQHNTFFTMSRLLIKQKRQDVLIQAFKKAHDLDNTLFLEIYGSGPDKDILDKIINDLNCNAFIKICKPIPNIHDTIINHRGFIITSDYEGMSNALLEAYCLGIPCISSDWPGVNDIITHNLDGMIYKRQDVEELVRYILLIAHSHEKCSEITSNAIKNKVKFETENIMEQYFSIITK